MKVFMNKKRSTRIINEFINAETTTKIDVQNESGEVDIKRVSIKFD